MRNVSARRVGPYMPKSRTLIRWAALTLGMAAVTPVAAQEQMRITNTASVKFDGSDGQVVSIASNTVAFPVEKRKRPTSLSFRLLPVGYQLTGMKCETSPTIAFTPAPISASDLAHAPHAESLDPGMPTILVLDNEGGNHDPNVREMSWINVDTQFFSSKLPLMETGPNTGVFAGGVPKGGVEEFRPCDPTLDRGARLTLSFTEDEFSYSSTTTILIDPTGYVFDSQTGALVDGATIELLDENNQPAHVFGDDGVSAYPSTVISGDKATDASGRIYDFPQGNYRFPLTYPGRYHLRVTPPAHYLAPSTKSLSDLQKLRDPKGKPFLLNEASQGGIFTLSEPDPFISDIPLDRIGESKLLLTKTASVREASPGDFVQYRIKLENRADYDVSGIHLTDILPAGLRYERGSARGAAEPEISTDGRTLNFPLAAMGAGRASEITYVVSISPGAPAGEAINRVLASGSAGATSNEAAAAVRLRPLLFTDGFTVIGRVTEGGCRDPESKRTGIAGIRLLLEDGTFVVTDKDGLYHFEGVRPGRHVVQLDRASMPATHEPVACDSDTRQAGSATSRFVESAGGLLKRVDFQLRPTGIKVATSDNLPEVAASADAAGDRNWFAGQAPGIALLFPEVDHNPRAPTLRVVVKHLPGQRVALRMNGQVVDALAFDSTDVQGEVAISKWTGVAIGEGDNALEARVLNADGSVAETLTRTVHSSSIPAQAAFVPGASRLVADGLTRPLIAVRITDRAGKPVRDGTTVPFTLDTPYEAAIDAELDQARQLEGKGRGATTARVSGDDGIAYIALQPTTQAGAVRAVVSLADQKLVRNVDVRAWLEGKAKDWTVVGFGAGTIGYDTLRKRASGLPASERGKVMTDGQLAFYAKGRVKGSWLLTIAYDSDRKIDRTRGLLGAIDPDRYYTVYGDGSRQGYDAATERKLYLRLERREFYALFGDFETGLTEGQLTRYSRTLNGVKAAYNGKALGVTAFAAHTDELYARDEIQGNGLSGPYRLSGRDIVPNSDKLRLQTRDRLRPERILSETPLTRHIDYDIDTSAGTIRFREPVLGRDAQNNPVFIVVDYETYGSGRKLVAGGRATLKLADGAIELGASAIHDETIGTGNLAGIDLRAHATTTTDVRAELATGGREGLRRGQAGLVEIEHHSAKIDMLAYARQQDRAFGLGQQNIVDSGTRKFGFDGRIRLTERFSLTGTAWHQDDLEGTGTRSAGEARVEYRRASGTIFAGVQAAFDRGSDGEDRTSKLVTLGGTQALIGGKLTLTGQTQFAPGGDKASVDFPARHQLLASYRVSDGIRLIGGYEIAQGKDYTANTARVGFDVAPWAGGKISSTINEQAMGENGTRTFAQYGLVQSLPISTRWTIDATLDASTTVRGRVPAGGLVQPFQTSGSSSSFSSSTATTLYGNDGDYTAVTLGAGYRADKWSWNGRVEYRHSDTSDRFGVTSNLLRSLGDGQTLASSVRYYTIAQSSGATAKSLAADIALALRPLDSRWSVLERLQFRNERADAGIGGGNVLGVPANGSAGQTTLRAINNLALNYRSGPEGAGHGLEATVYYGAKWVRGSFGSDDYTGYIDVTGFDIRQDIGKRIDIGVQGSVQHAWQRKSFAFSAGPSAGVSPAPNLWISAGYNVAGYRDRDFEDDRYTRSGPYVTMRLKFDRNSFGGLLGRNR